MLLVLSLIDLDHQILPDVITRPGTVLGIAASLGLHSGLLDRDTPVAQIVPVRARVALR